MQRNDPFAPNDLTEAERNAKALARGDLKMLADLVRMRQEKGLTQEAVAAALGRDKSAVSRFERLDSDPRMSTIRRYARAIGALVNHEVLDFDEFGRQPQPVALSAYVFSVAAPPSLAELAPAGGRYAN